MAASDVSLTFFKDNLDRVTEVADIVLLKEDLKLIYESVYLGKRTYNIIKQNIAATMALKALLILFIIFAEVPTGFIMFSIALDLLISVLTIINCFRIFKGIQGIKDMADSFLKSLKKKKEQE